MPLLDLQRQYLESFRLRIGAQAETNGKPRPVSLDHFRVTARAQQVCQVFATQYGGEVRPWQGPRSGDAWVVDLPVATLPVRILPGESLSQWWELWDSGGCVRRCDGRTERLTGHPCACSPDIDARMANGSQCRPTSRLAVICPDVATLGVGRLTTHSLIVARSLGATVELAQWAGEYVEALLSVVKTQGRRQYPLLYLDLVGLGWNEAQQLAGGEARAGLPAGSSTDQPTLPEGAGRPDTELRVGASALPVAGREPFSSPPPPSGEPPTGELISKSHHGRLMRLLPKDHDERLALLSELLGRQVSSSLKITTQEANQVTKALAGREAP